MFPEAGGDWIALGAIVCLLYLFSMLDTVSNLMLVFYSSDKIRKTYKRKGNYSIISLIVEIIVSPCMQHREPQAMEFIYAEMFSSLCDYVPFCVEYTVVNQQKAACEFVNSC